MRGGRQTACCKPSCHHESDDDWTTVHKTFKEMLIACIDGSPGQIFGLCETTIWFIVFLDTLNRCSRFIECLLKIICNSHIFLLSAKKFDLQCCLKGLGYYIYAKIYIQPTYKSHLQGHFWFIVKMMFTSSTAAWIFLYTSNQNIPNKLGRLIFSCFSLNTGDACSFHLLVNYFSFMSFIIILNTLEQWTVKCSSWDFYKKWSLLIQKSISSIVWYCLSNITQNNLFSTFADINVLLPRIFWIQCLHDQEFRSVQAYFSCPVLISRNWNIGLTL